jgi:hypothetical protein
VKANNDPIYAPANTDSEPTSTAIPVFLKASRNAYPAPRVNMDPGTKQTVATMYTRESITLPIAAFSEIHLIKLANPF